MMPVSWWECRSAGSDAVGSVHAATHAALDMLQSWLGQDRGGHSGGVDPLVALGCRRGRDRPAAAAVWGMWCGRRSPKVMAGSC